MQSASFSPSALGSARRPSGRALAAGSTPRRVSPFRSLSMVCALLLAGAPLRAAAAAPKPSAAEALSALAVVPARELRVTLGQLESQSGEPLGAAAASNTFWVRSPALRAWVGRSPRSTVELEFVYLGPTRSSAPLASGELRRQVGLELQARDSCNLLYVMWRIEPVQELRVSLKSNPGQSQHRECRDRGYVHLQPEQSLPLPPLRVGERHVLRASASPSALEVWVDGRRHWRGPLPAVAASLQGPVGIRSDNAELELQLRSTEPTR